LWIVGAFTCCAQSWTQKLDGSEGEDPPAWIYPFSDLPNGEIADASYDIPAAPGKSGLLVSLVFEEPEGGFLRVYWRSGEDSQTISDNLYEGIGLPNQRSLLIPQELLEKGGTVTFQSSGSQLGIHQISWEWLEPTVMLSSGGTELRLLDSHGLLLREEEVNGEPTRAEIENWEKNIVTASLLDQPERIEQGTEFSVELTSVPSLARLEGKISGLELNEPLILWVNGKKAGWILPETPDLRDAGYQTQSKSRATFAGWRKAAIIVGTDFLQTGINTLQFSTDRTAGEDLTPLALKDLKLQLDYTASQP
jgi:hypothetical protein